MRRESPHWKALVAMAPTRWRGPVSPPRQAERPIASSALPLAGLVSAEWAPRRSARGPAARARLGAGPACRPSPERALAEFVSQAARGGPHARGSPTPRPRRRSATWGSGRDARAHPGRRQRSAEGDRKGGSAASGLPGVWQRPPTSKSRPCSTGRQQAPRGGRRPRHDILRSSGVELQDCIRRAPPVLGS